MIEPLPTATRSRALYVIAAILLVGAAYVARPILVPLALSLLISLLLAPLVSALEKLRLGRVLSVAVVSAFSFSLVLGVGWLVLVQARNVAENIPTYRSNISARAFELRRSLESTLGRASEAMRQIRKEVADAAPSPEKTLPHRAPAHPPIAMAEDPAGPPYHPGEAPDEPVKVEVVEDSGANLTALTRTIGSAARPLITASLAFIFAVFILVWREDLRDRVIRVFGGEDVNFTTLALTETARSVNQYVLMLFLVNAANGVAVAAGLWLIGLPNALLWGLLFAVLRFMPFVGTFIAAALPILLALAVFESWTPPLLVIGLFVAVDAVSSNLLEPVLFGSHTGASSIAVLLAVLFWTWLWGPVGLILAMPLTVSLVALGKYVPELSFLTILLGNKPALTPDLQLYQRLLANDAAAARRVFERCVWDLTLVEAFEKVMLPAIVRAKRDHNRGVLDRLREGFLRETVDQMIDEAHQRELRAVGAARAGQSPKLDCGPVFCVPAFGRYDELIAKILARVLELDGLPARPMSRRLLAGELLQAVESEHPRTICITGIGDDGKVRARYLVKRLLRSHQNLQIVIGLWGTTADSNTAEHLDLGDRADMAFSLGDLRRLVGEKALAAALRDRAENRLAARV